MQSVSLQIPNESMETTCNYLVPAKFDDYPVQMNAMERYIVDQLKDIRNSQNKSKQCRICLENDQKQSKFVSACKCTGSVQYAHIHCLIEWIKRKIQQNPKAKASCQLCHSEFKYTVANQRIFDCNQLKRHYEKQKKSIICFGVVYGIFLLVFLGLILLMSISSHLSNLFLSQMLATSGGATIMSFVVVIYFVGLLVVAILFISEYVVRSEILITGVINFKEIKNLAKNYKIYFRR